MIYVRITGSVIRCIVGAIQSERRPFPDTRDTARRSTIKLLMKDEYRAAMPALIARLPRSSTKVEPAGPHVYDRYHKHQF